MRVFLVGLMGAGKTAIGRLLAKSLSLRFYDLDAEIERRAGASISWIFDVEGEAGFRRREASLLDELTLLDNAVLATGGGAILDAHNRHLLCDRGTVVFLDVTLETVLLRTAKDRVRPLLQVADRKTVLQDLMRARYPLYQSVATFTVKTDQRPVRAVVADIASLLKNPIEKSD